MNVERDRCIIVNGQLAGFQKVHWWRRTSSSCSGRLIRWPIGGGAEVGTRQSSGIEAGEVGATPCQGQMNWSTWVVLFNAQRLVRTVEGRSWDGEDKRWWLDGHSWSWTLSVAFVPHWTVGSHLRMLERGWNEKNRDQEEKLWEVRTTVRRTSPPGWMGLCPQPSTEKRSMDRTAPTDIYYNGNYQR